MIEKIKNLIRSLIHFLTDGIWNVDTNGIGALRGMFYKIIKAFILAYRKLDFTQMNTRAGSLTYSTLLSIVPMLAVLFAIARGFGFQNIVRSELFSYFSGQQEILEKAMGFIDKSLEYAQGGIFVGVGVVLLLYTVINLLSSIEDNFNYVWGIKVGRTYYRQFTDYVALLLIAPVFMVCNAGLMILINAASENLVIGVVLSPFVKILPFALTILLFTFMYMYIPNKKINFSAALFAGIIAGTAFQIFQGIYIDGQIWISKYNAIYGSFAALPLLLLWLQLSWLICLIGVELSFAYQNVRRFSFEKETDHISRRYKDFVVLSIMTLIVKRFAKGEAPYSADELSETYKIPTKLTSDVLFLLMEVGLIIQTPIDEGRSNAYVPAIDINRITVNFLFRKLDEHGTENLKINNKGEFDEEWQVILDIQQLVETKYDIPLTEL
ncbi:membrane protein [Dysgonomonas sp. PH5-45]|uniref:YihY/virulence factor BrkB family protein n=1 Tax=unclassified Dysgonomonas TaxID=2630389 RepID=UPI0024733E88|nr:MULTISPECIES: YihY/virulence factor BrkB family protein [unclassified Dysgonomonas]MDH6355349.1 membrane protein [Dysgonomonas sp. PH5-45]MDH6388247.1 membrane protein [Dysgonomonas sp. PH5-37]